MQCTENCSNEGCDSPVIREEFQQLKRALNLVFKSLGFASASFAANKDLADALRLSEREEEWLIHFLAHDV